MTDPKDIPKKTEPAIGHAIPGKWPSPPFPPKGPDKPHLQAMTKLIDPRTAEGRAWVEAQSRPIKGKP